MTDADVIREFLGSLSPCGRFVTQGSPGIPQALAALDRLVAALAEAEVEAKRKYEQGWHDATISARGRAARDERRYG